MNIILKAARLAAQAHQGQFRKGSSIPYFTHLARVAGRVASLEGSTPEMVAAAYLHDILEDTDLEPRDLEREFPSPVPEYVKALTCIPPGPGLNRETREAQYFERLKNSVWPVRVIKLCDRLDNLMDAEKLDPDFLGLYIEESEKLLRALQETNSVLEKELFESIFRLKTYWSNTPYYRDWDTWKSLLRKLDSEYFQDFEGCSAPQSELLKTMYHWIGTWLFDHYGINPKTRDALRTVFPEQEVEALFVSYLEGNHDT